MTESSQRECTHDCGASTNEAVDRQQKEGSIRSKDKRFRFKTSNLRVLQLDARLHHSLSKSLNRFEIPRRLSIWRQRKKENSRT